VLRPQERRTTAGETTIGSRRPLKGLGHRGRHSHDARWARAVVAP